MAAPINSMYKPAIDLCAGKAVIKMYVDEGFHHSAGSMHGSVYFKNLDDAAYFAASAYEKEFFVLTTRFIIYLTRPVSQGEICAKGRVVNATIRNISSKQFYMMKTSVKLGAATESLFRVECALQILRLMLKVRGVLCRSFGSVPNCTIIKAIKINTVTGFQEKSQRQSS